MSEATPNSHPQLPGNEGRVSARTLLTIRWIAVLGQSITLAMVTLGLNLPLPLPFAVAAVAVSVIINLFAIRRLAHQPFLGDRDAAFYLAYDMVQLAVLLYLTGGLDNPFAVMMLAPLTVAASTLGREAVTMLVALAVLCFTTLALTALPLPWPGQTEAGLPPVYRFGVWTALTMSAGFIAGYLYKVADGARRLSMALNASQEALARAQSASAVGALAAAAAHELGSPLGTIAVVAKELARDTPPDSPIAEDVALLQSQVARCRDILAELSRRPGDRGGAEPFVPIAALLETTASPYFRPGISLEVVNVNEPEDGTPNVQPVPEMVHGMANILQNAMQFAASRVLVTVDWTAPGVALTVQDDGPGYPPALLPRLGEPYVSGRTLAAREAAGNMGLGLFIAQTLLERSGAVVTYANGRSGGAMVAIRWKHPTFTV
ncbi:ActS/PrrB/RegB family redox-sensitive histidine kinase [Niveispirillum sp. BGYR6]|uniref:ActS/PrrB/RegB family redox-sensitive histidine kinase n=1 Tax=Niveispirillum sp. BGYR6 TaxID=2971249 RepID=UPI0022B9538A|nr:ActS/PrrB/RegB family redox-sensitive histidine kinase [Niveispirillum sp. BGYR6]MDG5495893.1 ActS/PrrB/RegB family redox-sensitive histidine kinase [Niveispirillum sp. BGYR6]